MSSDITVFDGATTPVSHVFNPVSQGLSRGGSKIMYLDRSANGGVVVGYPEIHVTAVDVVGTAPVLQYTVKAVWPVLETISNNTATGYVPAPQRAYHLQYEGNWKIPKRSTSVDRKAFEGLIANLYDNSVVKQMIVDLVPQI